MRSRIARYLAAGAVAIMFATLDASGPSAPVRADGNAPRGVTRFMWAVAQQESGGDYCARNKVSGAFGKYQIMPFNWPNWAGLYVGNRHARKTPWNQERVAYGKFLALHKWLGNWRRAAHWWLTGSSERREDRWSAYSRNYVDNVSSLMRRAPRGLRRAPAVDRGARRAAFGPDGCFGVERRSRIRYATVALHLRRRPGVRSESKRVLLPGTRLRVLDRARSESGRMWLRVRTPSERQGWVRAKYTRAR